MADPSSQRLRADPCRAIPQQTKVNGAYVNSFNARRTAERAGFHDGIMLDREGRLAEASAANFFAIQDGGLITPDLNPDVFPGDRVPFRSRFLPRSRGLRRWTDHSCDCPKPGIAYHGKFRSEGTGESSRKGTLQGRISSCRGSPFFRARRHCAAGCYKPSWCGRRDSAEYDS